MNEKTAISTDLAVRDPIKAAVQLCRQESAIENLPAELEDATRLLAQVNKLESSLFPVEQGFLPVLRSKKSKIASRVRQLQSMDKLGDYNTLFSLEPLTWRNKEGFPRLAVFSLNSPNFELVVTGSYISFDWGDRRVWKKEVRPKLPKEITACYRDVLDQLVAIAKKTKKTTCLRSQFAILIPQSVRAEIVKVRKEFKEIFIVAEVPHWDLKQTAIPRPNKDPLVVGYDGVNFWLITAFDPTSLEEYIKAEFCVKPQ